MSPRSPGRRSRAWGSTPRSRRSRPTRVPSLRFSAIGTEWQLDTALPISADLEVRLHARIDDFDRTYSRFRADSLVSAVAEAAGSYRFPDDACRLFDLYDGLFDSTHGAVTPLVGRALEQLGYDARYSLARRGPGMPAPDWGDEVSCDGCTLTTRSPVLIDVGAAGKGYLVDLVGELLHEGGIHTYVIEATAVALEHPFDPSMAIGEVTLADRSICASGSNRRVWGEGLHHILDGRTGEPTRDVIATWAIADTALLADGLATALFFADPADLAETFEFEWVRVFSTGTAERSAELPGRLFS